MKNIVIVLGVAVLFTGCEKVVSLDYKNNQSRIVIEGNITDQPGPYFVKITKTISLKENGAYPAVDGAIITISDNAGNSEVLVAEGQGMYRTSSLVGTAGRTYMLNVQTEGQTYTAQSVMPERVPFDSVKVEKVLFAGETEYNLIPVYRDPNAHGNHYRFVLSVNNKLVNQHFVQNDVVKNGVANTLRLEVDDSNLELKQGDLINIKMQCIDKNVALYYTTLALISDSSPGGGTTPNNPPSNISNGALGLFSAHTEESRSVVL